MKIKSVFAVMLVSLMLSGCDQRSGEYIDAISQDEAMVFVNKLQYVKDRLGICYAMISNRTYYGNIVITFTEVDCAKVELKK